MVASVVKAGITTSTLTTTITFTTSPQLNYNLLTQVAVNKGIFVV